MDKDQIELFFSRLDRLEDKIDEHFTKTDETISGVKEDVNKLKTRFAMIAISFGLAGGKISSLLPFLK